MLGKKEVTYNGNTGDSFTDTAVSTILEYDKTVITVKNTNLSGSSYSLMYSVLATPSQYETTPDWVTLVSGVVVTAGNVSVNKTADPWDGIKVQHANALSGYIAQAKIYVNRK